jgi:NADH-quinone oxidoreductase subunit J
MGLAAAFWIMAIVIVGAALAVVFLRNIFRAALALILCFIAVAGIYLTLSADFLAAVQILVYVGAISVLIILAVMMTRDVHKGNPGNRLKLPALVVGRACCWGSRLYSVTASPWQIGQGAAADPPDYFAPGRAALRREQGFILPVEIAAHLTVAAILGRFRY